MNRNCISHWFPMLAQSGVPVPQTHIVHEPGVLLALEDGLQPAGYENLLRLIAWCAQDVGFPAFLRMGCASGKHDWEDCCVIRSEHRAHIEHRLHSSMVDSALKDLDTGVVAIREMIRTKPMFLAFHGRMPITREFRFFVEKREIKITDECREDSLVKFKFPEYEAQVYGLQAYWPEAAIEKPVELDMVCSWQEKLAKASVMTRDEFDFLSAMVEQAMEHFYGAQKWSVDCLQDVDGKWWITDMAVAEASYTWSPSFWVVEGMPNFQLNSEVAS